MNELTKAKYRILARIENYIGDIEFAEEKELTEDEKTIFASVKHIINEEFDRVTPSNTEHIIKTTIKEYLDKDCDDVTELLLALNKDLCERIRKGE
jgi:DNA replication initiation complex subunit (GINS family)